MDNTDYVIIEGDLTRIKDFVTKMEAKYEVKVTKPPHICLTMIKAEDSLEHQPFYLGEALTTETEVVVNGLTGTGICIGDEPQRSYCLAVVDALVQLKDDHLPEVESFLSDEYEAILKKEKEEQHQVLRTQVDFKLMEQA
ncbi:MAG: phosphonate C-P lyase system protein PhnG [Bacteroidota bacterium]